MVYVNKKVRNATKVVYDGIKFDSILECYFYKALKANAIEFELKPKYTLLPKFTYLDEKIRACTYTPDYKVGNIIIDTKGSRTDVFDLKLKMFKKVLADTNQEFSIELPRNQKECNELINRLK